MTDSKKNKPKRFKLINLEKDGKGISKSVRSLPGKESISRDLLDISIAFVEKAPPRPGMDLCARKDA